MLLDGRETWVLVGRVLAWGHGSSEPPGQFHPISPGKDELFQAFINHLLVPGPLLWEGKQAKLLKAAPVLLLNTFLDQF